MSAQLDNLSLVPTVDQPLATTTSIREAVLAQFKDAETTITGLAEKYRDVAFDVATPKGMRDAIAARADLRDNGRLMVTKAEARIKGEVNDLKRVMSSEVDRLVAIVKPVEDAVDAQIKAEDQRKAAEKAERERIAAEKAAVHQAKIAKIRAAADNAKGISSDRIMNGIAMVEGLDFGVECEDFLSQYQRAKEETITSMRSSLAEAQAREAAEAQRLENERMAAELAAQRKALEEAQSALAAQAEKVEAQRLAAARAAVSAIRFPEPEPVVEVARANPPAIPDTVLPVTPDASVAQFHGSAAVAFTAINDSEKAEAIEPEVAQRLTKLVASLVAEEAVSSAKTSSNEAATVKLGDICNNIGHGFTMTASFVENVLGIKPAAIEKAAKLYRPSDERRIHAALINHLNVLNTLKV
jgi:hypothetical protein